MSRRRMRAVLVPCLAFAWCVCAAGLAAPGPRAGWRDARAELNPTDARAYFELGEIALADGAQTDAVRLFVLAATIALEHDQPEIGASACLALASLDLPELPPAWVQTLARSFDPDATTPSWRTGAQTDTSDAQQTQLRAAAALASLRTGAMAEYHALARDPDVIAALARTPEIQRAAGGVARVTDWLDELADEWPCTRCRGTGIERRRTGDTIELAVCPDCNGYPPAGRTLESLERSLVLRAELRLLGQRRTSWLADRVVAGDEPYSPPSVPALAARLGINPAWRVFRGNAWVAPTIPAQATGADE